AAGSTTGFGAAGIGDTVGGLGGAASATGACFGGSGRARSCGFGAMTICGSDLVVGAGFAATGAGVAFVSGSERHAPGDGFAACGCDAAAMSFFGSTTAAIAGAPFPAALCDGSTND